MAQYIHVPNLWKHHHWHHQTGLCMIKHCVFNFKLKHKGDKKRRIKRSHSRMKQALQSQSSVFLRKHFMTANKHASQATIIWKDPKKIIPYIWYWVCNNMKFNIEYLLFLFLLLPSATAGFTSFFKSTHSYWSLEYYKDKRGGDLWTNQKYN